MNNSFGKLQKMPKSCVAHCMGIWVLGGFLKKNLDLNPDENKHWNTLPVLNYPSQSNLSQDSAQSILNT